MTQFLISPNDDIMRIFGGDKLFGVFNSPMFASLPDNEPLTQSSMLTRKVTSVQKQVEGHNFDMRKHVLEYDDVMNKHREIIYRRRNTILSESEDTSAVDEYLSNLVYERVKNIVLAAEGKGASKEKIVEQVHEFLGRNIIDDLLEAQDIAAITGNMMLADYIADRAVAEIEVIKSEAPSPEAYYDLLKRIMLQAIDRQWMNHIDSMSKLREQVAFVGYAQKQPLMVYKEQAFKKFEDLLSEIEFRTVKGVFSISANTQVVLERVDDSKLQVQSTDVENMRIGGEQAPVLRPSTQETPQSGNPLFANPQNGPKIQVKMKNPEAKQISEKKKIRV